jgi:hypothetical protein
MCGLSSVCDWLTSPAHYDIVGIQHFFEHNLMPWLKKNTTLDGALLLVRSDGCAGQMKSARHFRLNTNVVLLLHDRAAAIVACNHHHC